MCGYTLPACIADSKTSECTRNTHTHARTQTYTHAQIHKMSAHMYAYTHKHTLNYGMQLLIMKWWWVESQHGSLMDGTAPQSEDWWRSSNLRQSGPLLSKDLWNGKEKEREMVLPGVEPRASGLSRHCSATEPRHPPYCPRLDNLHRSSVYQSFFIVLVMLSWTVLNFQPHWSLTLIHTICNFISH